MQHEALERFAFEVFDLLRFLWCAEGDGDEGLGLAAGEDCGAVCARKNAELDRDRTDLIELAAVDALTFVENDVAENLAFHLFDGRFRRGGFLRLFDRDEGENLFDDFLHRVFARVFSFGEQCLTQRRAVRGEQFVVVLVGVLRRELHVELRLAARCFAKIVLQRADSFDLGMRGVEGIEHDAFIDFARARFDHDDRVGGAGDDEIEIGQIALLICRIDHDLSVEIADAHGADRLHERNLADHERRRCGVDREDVRIVVAVRGENQRDDLRFLTIAFRE